MLHLQDLRILNDSQLALSLVACLGVLVIRACIAKPDRSLPLPPSPPTWRLWGHFLPSVNPFLTIAGWIDEYGPVITTRSFTQKIVIIGRHKAAVDIMERQGASLADRPYLVAIEEILTGGQSIAFAHGDRLRRMRRALHTHLQPKAAEEYQPLQTLCAKKMVCDILDDRSKFIDHIVTYAATTIMKIAYGKNTPTAATDPEVIEVRRAVARFRIFRRTTYIVEWIPWLKYLPWYGQELRRDFESSKRLNINHLNRVRQQMQSNMDIGPSFTKYMLENSHLYGLKELEMAFLSGSFFRAGSDAVSSAICTVLMAAACFPEEQAKVQAELDEVVGRNRAPTFADQQSLPRMQALISEALRWRPLAPSGLPHQTTKDVVWDGYFIPAGTTVFGNHWAISRDPEVFPEPHEFKPQRWINDRGVMRDDLKFFVYGFGRRVCPAQHVANRSVFITSLLVLWTFQLKVDRTKPFDDMGIMNGDVRACSIEFKMRIPEGEVRQVMGNHSEVL